VRSTNGNHHHRACEQQRLCDPRIHGQAPASSRTGELHFLSSAVQFIITIIGKAAGAFTPEGALIIRNFFPSALTS